MGTAAKLNNKNQKQRGNVTDSGNTGKVPQESGITENKKKGCRGHKKLSDATGRNYKHRGVSNNGTRHTIPQNKENLPEPDKIAKLSKYAKYAA